MWALRLVLVMGLVLGAALGNDAAARTPLPTLRRPGLGALVDVYKRARLDRAAKLKQPLVTKGNPVKALPRGNPDRLVVGVMGSAAKEATIPTELKRRLWQLGKTIARSGHVVLTGACPGMPQLTARAAKRNGGYTVGVSPAANLKEHAGKFHSPTKSLDVIQMTATGAGMGFIAREKQNIHESDIMVFVGGRSGTLGEILFAMQERKVIALLEDSTGVTSKTKSQILPLIGKGKGVFVSDRDPVKLMDKAVAAHRALQAAPDAGEARRAGRAEGGRSMLGRLGRSLRLAPRRWASWRADRAKMQRAPVITDEVTARHNVYTFFGTSKGLDREGLQKVMTLVEQIAGDTTGGRKPLLVTPTRRGLTTQVARTARKLGVSTLGISPAKTAGQHRREGRPRRAFDAIRLTGEGPGVGELAAYQHGIQKSDVVFVAGGDHLTLGGTVFAMYQPTVVAVLEAGGMSGKLRSDILSTFNKPAHAQMIYDSDPVRLYQRATQAAQALRSQQKTEYIAPE